MVLLIVLQTQLALSHHLLPHAIFSSLNSLPHLYLLKSFKVQLIYYFFRNLIKKIILKSPLNSRLQLYFSYDANHVLLHIIMNYLFCPFGLGAPLSLYCLPLPNYNS